MKNQALVSDIMTREVLTVDAGSKLKVAEKLMKQKHIRHMPVVKGERLVGMISLNDLLRLSFVDAYGYEEEESVDTALYQMLNVEQVMSGNPKIIQAGQSIAEVAKIFVREDYHALPVLNDDALAGIVTTTDVIRYMLENC